MRHGQHEPGTRLRVTLLNPCFWPEVRRGSERLIREIADGLIDRGHTVRLIAGVPGLPSRREERGLNVLRVPRLLDGYLERRAFPPYLSHTPFTYLALTTGYQDIAHAFYFTDAAVAGRWSHETRRPAVFSYAGLPSRSVLASRRGMLKLLVKALDGANAVVVVSHAAADGMRRWLGVDPRVIYPAIDCDVFKPAGERAEEPTIVSVAAWEDSRKRVPLLVEAFARVRRVRPNAKLVLMTPRDPKVAAELRLIPGVELDSLDPPSKLPDLYRRAWVSVLASYNEAFGMVLGEALACGTPVVGSDDGGAREIIDRPEVGRLFAGDEPEAVAQALVEAFVIAEDPGTSAICRESAMRFSTHRCADAHEQLYRELLER